MKKIKIAQIGVSMDSHGRNIFESICKQTDIFEVVGYHLPENEAEKYKDEDLSCFDGYPELSLDEILNDDTITAVTVETEEVYLTKYALLAARHGKHIHMEKPGGVDSRAFEELIDTVRKNQTVFHIGYMYRYNPYVVELMQDIKAGKLGDIFSVDASMNCPQPESRYETLARLPGGMMFFLGCHLIDLVLQIKGMPKEVLPFRASSRRVGDVPDITMALFRYDVGSAAIQTTGCQKGGYVDRHLTVTGSKATVKLCPFEHKREDGLFTGRTVYESTHWNDDGVYDESEVFDRYDSMMAAFGAMVGGEKQNPYTYDYELALFNIVCKCCGIDL